MCTPQTFYPDDRLSHHPYIVAFSGATLCTSFVLHLLKHHLSHPGDAIGNHIKLNIEYTKLLYHIAPMTAESISNNKNSYTE